MIPELDTPERVMNAMLRGDVAPITMNQCANVHGYRMVQAFADIHELWDDVKYALDALFEFKGGTMREKANSILQHFEYLQLARQIAETNERAARAVVLQDREELLALRARFTNETIGGHDHEQVARQKVEGEDRREEGARCARLKRTPEKLAQIAEAFPPPPQDALRRSRGPERPRKAIWCWCA